MIVLAMMALAIARYRGTFNEEQNKSIIDALTELPMLIERR